MTTLYRLDGKQIKQVFQTQPYYVDLNNPKVVSIKRKKSIKIWFLVEISIIIKVW